MDQKSGANLLDPVQVHIYGQVYSIKGADDPDHIRDLAEFIDAKMREVEKGTGTVDPHRVAILAALTIADELYRLRTRCRDLELVAGNAAERMMGITEAES